MEMITKPIVMFIIAVFLVAITIVTIRLVIDIYRYLISKCSESKNDCEY